MLCQNFRFEEKYYRSAMRELLHYLTGSVRLERFIDPRPTFSFWFAMKKNAYVHPPMPSCSPDGFSAIGKVHQSPSAKNVPPARFLHADIRVQHSPFCLLIEITDSPLDYPLFHGGECWTRTSDLLRVKQAL